MSVDEEQTLDGPLVTSYDMRGLSQSQIRSARKKYERYFVPGAKIRTAAGQEVAFNLRPKEGELFDWHADGKVSIAMVACKVCATINACRPRGSPPFVCLVQARSNTTKPHTTLACLHCRIRHNACSAKAERPDLNFDSNRGSALSSHASKRTGYDREQGSSSLSEVEDEDDSDYASNDPSRRQAGRDDRANHVSGSSSKRPRTEDRPEGDKSFAGLKQSTSQDRPSTSRSSEPAASIPSRPGMDTLAHRRKSLLLSSKQIEKKKVKRRHTDIPQSTNGMSNRSQAAIIISSSEEEGEGSQSVPGLTSTSNVNRAGTVASSESVAQGARPRLPGSYPKGQVVPPEFMKQLKTLKRERQTLLDTNTVLENRLEQKENELDQVKREYEEKNREIENLRQRFAASQQVASNQASLPTQSIVQNEAGASTSQIVDQSRSQGTDERQEIEVDEKQTGLVDNLAVALYSEPTTPPREAAPSQALAVCSGEVSSFATEGDISLGAMKEIFEQLKTRDKELAIQKSRLEDQLEEVIGEQNRIQPELEQSRVRYNSMLQAELVKLQ